MLPGAQVQPAIDGADRLFVNQGHLKVVLFDGREQSATFGRILDLPYDTQQIPYAWHTRAGVSPRTSA